MRLYHQNSPALKPAPFSSERQELSLPPNICSRYEQESLSVKSSAILLRNFYCDGPWPCGEDRGRCLSPRFRDRGASFSSCSDHRREHACLLVRLNIICFLRFFRLLMHLFDCSLALYMCML